MEGGKLILGVSFVSGRLQNDGKSLTYGRVLLDIFFPSRRGERHTCRLLRGEMYCRGFEHNGVGFIITNMHGHPGILFDLGTMTVEQEEAIPAVLQEIKPRAKAIADTLLFCEAFSYPEGRFWLQFFVDDETSPESLTKTANYLNSIMGEVDDESDFALMHGVNQLMRMRQKILNKEAKRRISKQRRSEFSGKQKSLMLSLIDRDGYFCKACRISEGLTIDHIHPLSKGGTDDLDNLQILCRACNSKKGDKTHA